MGKDKDICAVVDSRIDLLRSIPANKKEKKKVWKSKGIKRQEIENEIVKRPLVHIGGDQMTEVDIIAYRKQLLEHIPANKKRKKDWLVSWNQLQSADEAINKGHSIRKLETGIKSIQEIHPWINRCSDSLILAWRDVLFKDIKIESLDL